MYWYIRRFGYGISRPVLNYGRGFFSAVYIRPLKTRWNENKFYNKISETNDATLIMAYT